jgi:hypothetical protein
LYGCEIGPVVYEILKNGITIGFWSNSGTCLDFSIEKAKFKTFSNKKVLKSKTLRILNGPFFIKAGLSR